jgi:hypothetical protein
MSHSIIRTAFDVDPKIEEICEFVSNGGSLIQYCKHNGLPFADTRQWILNSDTRNSLYTEAMQARKDWAAQTLCAMLIEMLRFSELDLFDDNGRLLPPSEWPPEARSAIQQIDVDKNTREIISVKSVRKPEIIKMLGSTINLFADHVKVEGVQSLADMVLKAGKDDTKK